MPEQLTLLASAARTTTQTGSDQENDTQAKGIVLVLDVTSAGTGSITLSIQGRTPNGVYYTLLTGAAVTTNSTNVYRVFPGATAAANAVANDCLPPVWRAVVTANNANSMTYSLSAILV